MLIVVTTYLALALSITREEYISLISNQQQLCKKEDAIIIINNSTTAQQQLQQQQEINTTSIQVHGQLKMIH
jgi:hypothetical protein